MCDLRYTFSIQYHITNFHILTSCRSHPTFDISCSFWQPSTCMQEIEAKASTDWFIIIAMEPLGRQLRVISSCWSSSFIAKIYQIVYPFMCNIVHDCHLSICFSHDQILQRAEITYVGARVGAVERAGTRIGSTVLVGKVKKLHPTSIQCIYIIIVKPSDRTSGIDSV